MIIWFITFWHVFHIIQADEHESKTLDDVKENEPVFFERVTAVLKRAEIEFGLQHQ